MDIPLGVAFYLWVGVFSVSVVAQFWSFANDIYTPEQGKRLLAIVGFGASFGAICGPFIAGRLIEPIGEFNLLLIAGIVPLLSLVLTNSVDPREAGEVTGRYDEDCSEESIGSGGVYRLVFQSRYLLLIALMILFLNWVKYHGGVYPGTGSERAGGPRGCGRSGDQ